MHPGKQNQQIRCLAIIHMHPATEERNNFYKSKVQARLAVISLSNFGLRSLWILLLSQQVFTLTCPSLGGHTFILVHFRLQLYISDCQLKTSSIALNCFL